MLSEDGEGERTEGEERERPQKIIWDKEQPRTAVDEGKERSQQEREKDDESLLVSLPAIKTDRIGNLSCVDYVFHGFSGFLCCGNDNFSLCRTEKVCT